MMSMLLWGAYALLSLADGVLTWSLLRRRNKREGNPVMASLIARFGAGLALALFKTPAVLALGAGLYFRLPLIVPAAIGLNLMMAGVVGWNLWKLRK